MRLAERWALAGFAAIVIVTAGWWALALWPTSAATPTWLLRARAVCFDPGPSGLPGPSGWLLLIGQPLGMVGFLLVGWGPAVRQSLRTLWHRGPGRAVLAGVAMLILAGSLGAGWRVVGARRMTPETGSAPITTFTAIDRPAPSFTLVSQSGDHRGLPRGRPAFVTFAYGHCTTICPLLVQEARAARAALADTFDAAVIVVTLDPWRDTPARLPHIAARWQLEEPDLVLSGPVERVNAVLDAWRVHRRRDPQTGEITHPNLTYLVDADGVIRYAVTGGREELVACARALEVAG